MSTYAKHIITYYRYYINHFLCGIISYLEKSQVLHRIDCDIYYLFLLLFIIPANAEIYDKYLIPAKP